MSLFHASPSPCPGRHPVPALPRGIMRTGSAVSGSEDSEVVRLLFYSLEPPQLESNNWPLRKLLLPAASFPHHSNLVGTEGRRPRTGLGKILEGRREGVPFKLCLLIHGSGFVPPHQPQGPLDEAFKMWFLSILIHCVLPSPPYSPFPTLHAHQGLSLNPLHTRSKLCLNPFSSS